MNCKHLLFSLLLLWLTPAVLQAQFPCLNGMSINGPNGQGAIDLCQDGFSSTLNFAANITALPVGYLVVDENDVIVYIGTRGTIDFSNLPGNSFTVYAFNFIGSFRAEVGDPLGTPITSGCYALTANSISVTGDAPSAGMVSTEDGQTEAYTCPGDGLADIVRFDSSGVDAGASFTYLVTNENNVITEIIGGDAADFEDDSIGASRVWGLAYNGSLTAMVGDTATSSSLADGCFSLSANFVTIFRAEPEGGTVSTESGADMVSLCAGGGISDIVRFDSMGVSGGAFAYVVTDTNNLILFFPDSDEIDFDSAAAGICRVWGLAYTGAIIASAGDTASIASLSDGCFDLSDNYVTVDKAGANGGDISTDTGETEVFVCPDSLAQDTVRFVSNGAAGDNFTFVLTDTSNIILSFPDTGFLLVSNLNEGIYRLWGLAYNGALAAMAGDTASTTTLSDSCFALSNNFLTIYNTQPAGGSVSTESGDTEVFTCPGNGVPDTVRFDSSGVGSGQFAYIITDTNNVILGLPAGDFADFDGAGFGASRVWGLVYADSLLAMVGDTASNTSLAVGCYALSENYITVIHQQPDGGMVTTNTGATEAFTCPGDGVADIVQFDNSGALGPNYAFIATDTNNVVIEVAAGGSADFESYGIGVSRVWGFAYTGNLTVMAGDTASTAALSDDCFGLSGNFVTVYHEIPNGGSVTTEAGDTIANTCTGDGIAGLIRFDSLGASNSLYAYVATDTNAVILGISTTDGIDFEGADGGICYVWGLAYTGNITAMPGDTAFATALSDACFDLSDDFVIIIKEEVNGGMVSAEDGGTEVYLCPGDGLRDTVRFDSSGILGDAFTYLVTDTNNVVLSILAGDFEDFEDDSIGVSRVLGLVYSDSLTAMVGDTASVDALATGCYALSANFITIYRDIPDGGTLSTADGTGEVSSCTGSNLSGAIRFDSMDVVNSLFAYIITDTSDVILFGPNPDLSGFSGAGLGTVRVWGMAYTGNITAMVGDTLPAVALTDECYDLTDNFITANLEEVDGAMVQSIDGKLAVYTCPDSIPDIVGFESFFGFGESYTYIFTDTSNVALVINDINLFNFDPYPPGIYRIWGLAYSGNITALAGDSIFVVDIADGCYDLSDNFVTVNVDVPNGGAVSTETGDTLVNVTVGDGLIDRIRFDSIGASNSLYTYIITDTSGVVLAIPAGDEFDFENSGAGACLVWGLAYTGTLAFAEGDTLTALGSLSTDCFSLASNVVTVNRRQGPGIARPGDFNLARRQDAGLKLKAWPIPAKGHLMLSIGSAGPNREGLLRLLDHSGREMLRQEVYLEGSATRFELNTEGLVPGLYLLHFQTEAGQASLSVIKQ